VCEPLAATAVASPLKSHEYATPVPVPTDAA